MYKITLTELTGNTEGININMSGIVSKLSREDASNLRFAKQRRIEPLVRVVICGQFSSCYFASSFLGGFA